MLSEVVTCNGVRNPGGHAESNPRPSEEGVSFYHVLRPLDHVCMCAVCFFLAIRPWSSQAVFCKALLHVPLEYMQGGGEREAVAQNAWPGN